MGGHVHAQQALSELLKHLEDVRSACDEIATFKAPADAASSCDQAKRAVADLDKGVASGIQKLSSRSPTAPEIHSAHHAAADALDGCVAFWERLASSSGVVGDCKNAIEKLRALEQGVRRSFSSVLFVSQFRDHGGPSDSPAPAGALKMPPFAPGVSSVLSAMSELERAASALQASIEDEIRDARRRLRAAKPGTSARLLQLKEVRESEMRLLHVGVETLVVPLQAFAEWYLFEEVLEDTSGSPPLKRALAVLRRIQERNYKSAQEGMIVMASSLGTALGEKAGKCLKDAYRRLDAAEAELERALQKRDAEKAAAAVEAARAALNGFGATAECKAGDDAEELARSFSGLQRMALGSSAANDSSQAKTIATINKRLKDSLSVDVATLKLRFSSLADFKATAAFAELGEEKQRGLERVCESLRRDAAGAVARLAALDAGGADPAGSEYVQAIKEASQWVLRTKRLKLNPAFERFASQWAAERAPPPPFLAGFEAALRAGAGAGGPGPSPPLLPPAFLALAGAISAGQLPKTLAAAREMDPKELAMTIDYVLGEKLMAHVQSLVARLAQPNERESALQTLRGVLEKGASLAVDVIRRGTILLSREQQTSNSNLAQAASPAAAKAAPAPVADQRVSKAREAATGARAVADGLQLQSKAAGRARAELERAEVDMEAALVAGAPRDVDAALRRVHAAADELLRAAGQAPAPAPASAPPVGTGTAAAAAATAAAGEGKKKKKKKKGPNKPAPSSNSSQETPAAGARGRPLLPPAPPAPPPPSRPGGARTRAPRFPAFLWRGRPGGARTCTRARRFPALAAAYLAEALVPADEGLRLLRPAAPALARVACQGLAIERMQALRSLAAFASAAPDLADEILCRAGPAVAALLGLAADRLRREAVDAMQAGRYSRHSVEIVTRGRVDGKTYLSRLPETVAAIRRAAVVAASRIAMSAALSAEHYPASERAEKATVPLPPPTPNPAGLTTLEALAARGVPTQDPLAVAAAGPFDAAALADAAARLAVDADFETRWHALLLLRALVRHPRHGPAVARSLAESGALAAAAEAALEEGPRAVGEPALAAPFGAWLRASARRLAALREWAAGSWAPAPSEPVARFPDFWFDLEGWLTDIPPPPPSARLDDWASGLPAAAASLLELAAHPSAARSPPLRGARPAASEPAKPPIKYLPWFDTLNKLHLRGITEHDALIGDFLGGRQDRPVEGMIKVSEMMNSLLRDTFKLKDEKMAHMEAESAKMKDFRGDIAKLEAWRCGACGKQLAKDGLRKCGRCLSVAYCDQACHGAAWKTHKRECRDASGRA
eukprot:tig00000248_g21821.t1